MAETKKKKKKCKRFDNCGTLSVKIKNVPKGLLDWVEEEVGKCNCSIEKIEWKSKYNSYVVYDYEPFCSDGFQINILVESTNFNNLEFFKYLYEKRIENVEFLNSCLD